MALNIYDIIKSAVVSEKAQKENKNQDRLVLSVHPKSNKPLIKEAVEKLFEVKVDTVRVIVRKGKNRSVGRNKVVDSLQKKAIIKLKPGYSLDLFGTGEVNKETEKRPVADKKEDIG